MKTMNDDSESVRSPWILGLSDGHEWLVVATTPRAAREVWEEEEGVEGVVVVAVTRCPTRDDAEYLVDVGQSMVAAGEMYLYFPDEDE